MSGSWPSLAGKRAGVVRDRAAPWGDYTARRFLPLILRSDLALTAWGPQVPSSNEKSQPNGVPKRKQKRQPQERQHSDGEAVTRDRLPP
jgi:hypothetical protein